MSATTFFVCLPSSDGYHQFDFQVVTGAIDNDSGIVCDVRLFYRMSSGVMSGTSATNKLPSNSSYEPNVVLPLDYFQAPKVDWGDSMSYVAHPFFKIDLKDTYFARNFKFDSVSLDFFSMYKPINVYDGRVVSSGSSSAPSSSSVDASGFFANVDYSLDGNHSKFVDGQVVACADHGIFIVERSKLVASGQDALTVMYDLKRNISLDTAVTSWAWHSAPQSHLSAIVLDSAVASAK